MATEIIMPKVDMVMETGTFVEWLKKEGERVSKGEPIFVIMTDKAAIEVEAPGDGILAGLNAQPDDVIPVTNVIGYILAEGESLPSPVSPAPQPVAIPEKASENPQAGPAPTTVPPDTTKAIPSDETQLRATPLARNLAKEMGIDLGTITGRGPGGRIYKADVLAASARKEPTPAIPAAPAPVAALVSPALPDAKIRERIALRGPRAIIAQRMTYSYTTIPHIYETLSVDMTETVRMREKINAAFQERGGQKVSYTAILAHAVARLLSRHPYLNSSLSGEEIILWEDVNLGIATSLEEYLIVPVIRQAQTMNLEAIATEMNRLLQAAHSKRLEPAEMTGSTFTISNLGMFGIESFTAIINPPETAILAVGKMIDTPQALDGQIVIRPMLQLTLALDHRVSDGARAARFLTDLKAVLEDPYLLI